MTLEELRKRFVLPGVTFDTEVGGLLRVCVASPLASGQLFLHGAHCAAWQPAREAPVLWLSQHSNFQSDKPIRGGVPICFPWFGPHPSDKTQPAHGLARLKQWELAAVEIDSNEDVRVTCTTHIAPFDLKYVVTFGNMLSLALTTHLPASHPQAERFEDALHTYFSVSRIDAVAIQGLEEVSYIDKVDGGKIKPPSNRVITFSGETDRVYFDTTDACCLQDPIFSRYITVRKSGSKSSIVWNPWTEKSARMPDFGNDEWTGMLCIETANVGQNAITLQPGDKHTTVAEIMVTPF